MAATRITGGVGRENLVAIRRVGCGWYDTVGGEDNRTVEGGKLLALLPPRITIVTCKVSVFLECRIIMSRQHLAVRVDIHTRTLGLAQQFLQIVQIMSADQDTRILAHSDVHFRNLRMTVRFRMCPVEQCHHLYAHGTCFQCQCRQFGHGKIPHGGLAECPLQERMNTLVLISQTDGMIVIGRHSLQSVEHQFLKRPLVWVCFAGYSHGSRFCFQFFVRRTVPDEHIRLWQSHTRFCCLLRQTAAYQQAPLHPLPDGCLIKVCICDGRKQCIRHETVHVAAYRQTICTQRIRRHTDAFHHIKQQVHGCRCRCRLTANTL